MPASERSSSPNKRSRVLENENGLPDQSGSVVGSKSIVVLDSSTVLSVTSRGSSSSLKRNSSPSRDHPIELRTTPLSITTNSLSGNRCAGSVRKLRKDLTSEFGHKFVPLCLKVSQCRSSNPDRRIEPRYRQWSSQIITSWDEFEDDDYDGLYERDSHEIQPFFDEVQRICSNAQDCKQNHRDGNAWCMEVVQPLVQLAVNICTVEG
jgi:hypothetical protein